MNLKNGKIFTSKFVGTGPSSCEKRIYRAAVSQRLRNTGPQAQHICGKTTEENFIRCCKSRHGEDFHQGIVCNFDHTVSVTVRLFIRPEIQGALKKR